MRTVERRILKLEEKIRPPSTVVLRFNLVVGSEFRGRLIGARENGETRMIRRQPSETEAEFMTRAKVRLEHEWPPGETMRVLHEVRDRKPIDSSMRNSND
jgi:hypothetical protein